VIVDGEQLTFNKLLINTLKFSRIISENVSVFLNHSEYCLTNLNVGFHDRHSMVNLHCSHHQACHNPPVLHLNTPYPGFLAILIKSMAITVTIFCEKSIATAIPILFSNTNTGKTFSAFSVGKNVIWSVHSISVQYQLLLVYFLIKKQTQQIKHNILMIHDNQAVINWVLAEQLCMLTCKISRWLKKVLLKMP